MKKQKSPLLMQKERELKMLRAARNGHAMGSFGLKIAGGNILSFTAVEGVEYADPRIAAIGAVVGTVTLIGASVKSNKAWRLGNEVRGKRQEVKERRRAEKQGTTPEQLAERRLAGIKQGIDAARKAREAQAAGPSRQGRTPEVNPRAGLGHLSPESSRAQRWQQATQPLPRPTHVVPQVPEPQRIAVQAVRPSEQFSPAGIPVSPAWPDPSRDYFITPTDRSRQ